MTNKSNGMTNLIRGFLQSLYIDSKCKIEDFLSYNENLHKSLWGEILYKVKIASFSQFF